MSVRFSPPAQLHVHAAGCVNFTLTPLSFYFYPMPYNRYCGTGVLQGILIPDKLKSNIANVDCLDFNMTDKCLLYTLMFSKRILLNFSTSLLKEGKKFKTFITQNCFFVLTSDVIEDYVFYAPLITHNDAAENIIF